MGSSGETTLGIKITIGEARAAGAIALSASCVGAPVSSGGCRHSSQLTLMLALALWGEDRRLDDLNLRCSVCGSRKVEVRPEYGNGRPITQQRS